MAKGRSSRVRIAVVIFASFGAVLAGIPATADAQIAVGARGENPADALARSMKELGTSPRDFDSLITAGRASLALGDTQAAQGFFGRADEVWPQSPMPQAGMGAALAQEGDGVGAMQFFREAVSRGATQSAIGSDRGLAYDLMGQHSLAQADYRAALSGRDGDEARRRLALSLAISGNKAEALSMLSPLMARGDAAGARCRAFVLALTGDANGAKSAIEAAMPGSSDNMAYFFRKLPSLRSEQKVAAVNLGIFPDSNVQMASATTPRVTMNKVTVIQKNSVRSDQPTSGDPDRIGSIERWLSQATQGNATLPAQVTPQPSQQVAAGSVPAGPPPRTGGVNTSLTATRRLWIQLASGPNSTALPDQFDRLKSRNRDLFEGISGYVSEERGKARLLVGPFRNNEEANIFADDLASLHIPAFTWTSQPGQAIRKLPSE